VIRPATPARCAARAHRHRGGGRSTPTIWTAVERSTPSGSRRKRPLRSSTTEHASKRGLRSPPPAPPRPPPPPPPPRASPRGSPRQARHPNQPTPFSSGGHGGADLQGLLPLLSRSARAPTVQPRYRGATISSPPRRHGSPRRDARQLRGIGPPSSSTHALAQASRRAPGARARARGQKREPQAEQAGNRQAAEAQAPQHQGKARAGATGHIPPMIDRPAKLSHPQSRPRKERKHLGLGLLAFLLSQGLCGLHGGTWTPCRRVGEER
jgi:hypothetical protein